MKSMKPPKIVILYQGKTVFDLIALVYWAESHGLDELAAEIRKVIADVTREKTEAA